MRFHRRQERGRVRFVHHVVWVAAAGDEAVAFEEHAVVLRVVDERVEGGPVVGAFGGVEEGPFPFVFGGQAVELAA